MLLGPSPPYTVASQPCHCPRPGRQINRRAVLPVSWNLDTSILYINPGGVSTSLLESALRDSAGLGQPAELYRLRAPAE